MGPVAQPHEHGGTPGSPVEPPPPERDGRFHGGRSRRRDSRYPRTGAAWARWPNRSSKPVRSCNPRLGRFDSGAAPSVARERLGGPRLSDAERELERDAEHQVTPLELFFDLVLVFAITQVTSLLAHDPTWRGVLHGMLVLAALWWAWIGYAWLTSAMDVDEGGVRLAMLASMGTMLVVALAVPRAFGAHAVLFGAAYLLVRVLHLVLSAIVGRGDPTRRGALLRFAPTALAGASLILL